MYLQRTNYGHSHKPVSPNIDNWQLWWDWVTSTSPVRREFAVQTGRIRQRVNDKIGSATSLQLPAPLLPSIYGLYYTPWRRRHLVRQELTPPQPSQILFSSSCCLLGDMRSSDPARRFRSASSTEAQLSFHPAAFHVSKSRGTLIEKEVALISVVWIDREL